MYTKKYQEKKRALPELETSISEVLVANGRSFQPFVRTFNYTGENISKSNLGTLLGAFEIDDQNDDSAYIVNFIASVAKKEYFNNPRRGAVESFEAALHKINIALAELVKHGNITWLGKFHGALGIVEKNNLHFSVTGQAKILLLRNSNLSDISEGLASEESHTHPLKTFVEVSSGRLAPLDQILLASPELLALFSLEELNKHALRMSHEQFSRFLKTALVNEVDMTGLIILDVKEKEVLTHQALSPKTTDKVPSRTDNVFSQLSFLAKQPSKIPTPKEEPAKKESKKEEYIDTKTGHIYVQGDFPASPGRHHFFEDIHSTLREFSLSLLTAQGRWFRRVKKQAVIGLSVFNSERKVFERALGRAWRKQWRKYQEKRKKQVALQPPEQKNEKVAPPVLMSDMFLSQEETPILPEEISDVLSPSDEAVATSAPPSEQDSTNEIPQFIKEKLSVFYQKSRQISSEFSSNAPSQKESQSFSTEKMRALAINGYQKTLSSLQIIWQFLRKHLLTLPKGMSRYRQKYTTIGFVVSILCIVFVVILLKTNLLQTDDSQTIIQNEIFQSNPPETNNAHQNIGSVSFVLDASSDTIITSIILNDEVYVVSEKSIVTVIDKKSYALPGGDTAQFAAAMDDLRLIFVYTSSGKLYAFSPISKKFVENSLALVEGASVTGIDTYLTYLYVLDSTTDQIYRFPRADGGFGTATPWFKEAISIEEDSHLAVNEAIFVSPHSTTIQGFFRGKPIVTLEAPGRALSITDIYTHPKLENVYVLDHEHQNIIIWSQDGRLIKEFSHPKLSEGQTLSVNEKNNEIFVSTTNSLLSFKWQ